KPSFDVRVLLAIGALSGVVVCDHRRICRSISPKALRLAIKYPEPAAFTRKTLKVESWQVMVPLRLTHQTSPAARALDPAIRSTRATPLRSSTAVRSKLRPAPPDCASRCMTSLLAGLRSDAKRDQLEAKPPKRW